MEKPISATTSLGKGGEIRKSDEQWESKKSVQRLETLFQGDQNTLSENHNNLFFEQHSRYPKCSKTTLATASSWQGSAANLGGNLLLGIWNQQKDLKQLS